MPIKRANNGEEGREWQCDVHHDWIHDAIKSRMISKSNLERKEHEQRMLESEIPRKKVKEKNKSYICA